MAQIGNATSPTTAESEELARLKEQLRATTQKLHSAEKVLNEAGDLIRYDSYGNAVGWDEQALAQSSEPEPESARVQEGGSQTDAHFQDLLAKQGYLTQSQWNQYREELRGEALGNIHLFRTLDKTLASKEYGDLSKYDGDWAKRTAQVLQDNGWGRPLDGAKDWDNWQYVSSGAFKIAADIAQAQLHREFQASGAAESSAKSKQAAAGLSVGQTSGGGSGPVDYEKLARENPDELDRVMREDIEKQATNAGIIIPR